MGLLQGLARDKILLARGAQPQGQVRLLSRDNPRSNPYLPELGTIEEHSILRARNVRPSPPQELEVWPP